MCMHSSKVNDMCGILGVFVSEYNRFALEKIEQLMKGLLIRGHHSIGIAFYDDNKIQIYKSMDKDGIKGFVEILDAYKPKRFIFHNRYSTSGDWHFVENNQPIHVSGIGAIATNGVLSMKTKDEMEADFGVKLNCDNDAEVF